MSWAEENPWIKLFLEWFEGFKNWWKENYEWATPLLVTFVAPIAGALVQVAYDYLKEKGVLR